jgi:uncharacterized protein
MKKNLPGGVLLTPEEKLERLKASLQRMKGAVIAVSGGVDSTFLMHIARQVLGDKAVAVTFDSPIHARAEINEVKEMFASGSVKHRILRDDSLMENQEFLANPPGRCYICKKVMMERLKLLAAEMGIATLMDGSNADDLRDFRPGMQAAAEAGVVSPLQEAGFSKEDIRFLAWREGLTVWNKPSSPCLCSRIPYGQSITARKLEQIEKGEALLHKAGFRDVRLRHHGVLVRVEIPAAEFIEILEPGKLDSVITGLKELGFHYVTLDLEGLRSGSLNEVL